MRVERPGETDARVSNQLPFVLAPTLTLPPDPPASIVWAGSELTVVVGCSPEIKPGQPASLILGHHEAFANAHPDPVGELTFVFENIAGGNYPVRLRVDGAESWLIDKLSSPPAFDPAQTINVPPPV